jgi:hypothetical protein
MEFVCVEIGSEKLRSVAAVSKLNRIREGIGQQSALGLRSERDLVSRVKCKGFRCASGRFRFRSDRHGTTVEGAQVNRIGLSIAFKFNRITEKIARFNFGICKYPNEKLAINTCRKFVKGNVPVHDDTCIGSY